MGRKALPSWAVSFFWGKKKRRKRHYFKTWAIPKGQITDEVQDRRWFRVQITGPGYDFRGIVKLTSGEEVPLPKDEAERLENAMRKHPREEYSIALIGRAVSQD